MYCWASGQTEIAENYSIEHYSLVVVVVAESCPDIVKHVAEVPVEKGY